MLQTTRDWSFVADRLCGDNWFLAGDSAGFADPILSAGLTLAQSGGRRVAYSILEVGRTPEQAGWIKREYDRAQRAQIRNHINFADYWYSANGHFTDLKAYCAEIAKSAGIELEPEEAFRWMGTGGFSSDKLGEALSGTFSITAIKKNIGRMSGRHPTWEVERLNSFKLNIGGATVGTVAIYDQGRIIGVPCYMREGHILPNANALGAMVAALMRDSDLEALLERFAFLARSQGAKLTYGSYQWVALETLEALLAEGWVTGSVEPNNRRVGIVPSGNGFIFGWLKEGIGITSMNATTPNRLLVDWAAYCAAKNGT